MDTPCDVVKEYNAYTPLHVVQGLQISFSVLSLIVVIYTAVHFLARSIFERVFKELLFLLYFLMLAHSLVIVALQGILVTVRLSAADPCEAQISKLLCYAFRISTAIPVAAFVWIHLGITRIVSTFTGNERVQLVIGRMMIAVSFLYPSIITYFAYRTEVFEGRVPYCTGATPGSAQISQANLLFLFSLDVLNLLLDVALLKYNQYKLKFDKSFHMMITFRRRQNVYSIQQFLPSAVFHCVCYMVQVFMMLFGRTFRGRVTDLEFSTINAYTYLMPYYCSIGPIILLILMRKGMLIRKENLKNVVVPMSDEAYFESLRNQWETADTARPIL